MSDVLIDTWWNVNYLAVFLAVPVVGVLIDTWWNVNDDGLAEYKQRKSFNRYMVECESAARLFRSLAVRVLIDTWWNVNFEAGGIQVDAPGF